MLYPRLARLTLAVVALSACAPRNASQEPATAAAQDGSLNQYGNPARMRPAPTAADITERDLKIRLYQFADDSMMGRQVGRLGNKKGTDYIAAEV